MISDLAFKPKYTSATDKRLNLTFSAYQNYQGCWQKLSTILVLQKLEQSKSVNTTCSPKLLNKCPFADFYVKNDFENESFVVFYGLLTILIRVNKIVL